MGTDEVRGADGVRDGVAVSARSALDALAAGLIVAAALYSAALWQRRRLRRGSANGAKRRALEAANREAPSGRFFLDP